MKPARQHDYSRFDYSTIDGDAVRKLPTWDPSTSNYHLQDSCGSGCYGDPPGFPTYFTQSVYTSVGDTPRQGTTQVIWFDGAYYSTENAHSNFGEHAAKLAKLYKPLPESHPRTQAWIACSYQRLVHCYRDPGPYRITTPITKTTSWKNGVAQSSILDAGGQKFSKFEDTLRYIKSFDAYAYADIVGVEKSDYGRDPALLIYPVPSYKLRYFHDDHRFSEEWRLKEQASIAQTNAEIQAQYAAACVPENHQAFIKIRKWYPEHQIPTREVVDANGGVVVRSYVDAPPEDRPGDWWEREAKQPTPRTCPGSYGAPHRTNGWCQYCGYITE